MKVGIDIDGTITANPELFQVLTKALVEDGSEVFILTFRDESDRNNTEELLSDLSISYTRMLMGSGIADAALKVSWVKDLGIDCVFEDNESVLDALPPNVTRFWVPPTWARIQGLGLVFR